ncbi:SDR family oxidoreductase [Streptococcus pacificus]|uniref:SDR family oxidoreductase n=1 Tax=Streptococcus pacificus TaxID=2740577 RepID=A0ABS0ZJI4_9STRE|nr:SDR family oxidoreductase [Streptococcus pacificus]MBJ8325878.1 SDR family oxidoreductase [Streptococcus pacificus]
MTKEKVLLAGATGYLGKFVMQELIKRGYPTKIVVRNKNKVSLTAPNLEIIEAQVTKPEELKGICENVDVVISTVGITRQKDGLTYMDVDYQANANLINEAKKSGVKKVIYVSVLKGEKLRHLKICEAKEKLGDYLKASGLDYCIIRPNGFFSDMVEFLNMAKSGKVYLFGDGTLKLNPIHGKDLAVVIVDSIMNDEKELDVGGPELLSQNEIAELALKAYHKKIKIVHLPDFFRRFALFAIRTFTGQKTYGPLEFFMTTMAMDMSAPRFGNEKLEPFFNQEVINRKNNH